MCRRRRQSWDRLSKTSHRRATKDSPRRADQMATLSCTQGRNHRVPIPALRQSQTCSDVSTQGWAEMPQRRTTAKKGISLQRLAGRPLGSCSLASVGVSSEQPPPAHPHDGASGAGSRPSAFPGCGLLAGSSWCRSFCITQRLSVEPRGRNLCV